MGMSTRQDHHEDAQHSCEREFGITGSVVCCLRVDQGKKGRQTRKTATMKIIELIIDGYVFRERVTHCFATPG